jgi:xanthine dehydrogenase molybdopterin-binding subunit B
MWPQVSGVADYVDDMPSPPGTLHAAPIMATVPHAYLRSVDSAAAYALNETPTGAFGLDGGQVRDEWLHCLI